MLISLKRMSTMIEGYSRYITCQWFTGIFETINSRSYTHSDSVALLNWPELHFRTVLNTPNLVHSLKNTLTTKKTSSFSMI